MAEGKDVKSPQLVVPHVYQISLGIVNAFLLESDDGLVLIDTGTLGSANKILGRGNKSGSPARRARHHPRYFDRAR